MVSDQQELFVRPVGGC